MKLVSFKYVLRVSPEKEQLTYGFHWVKIIITYQNALLFKNLGEKKKKKTSESKKVQHRTDTVLVLRAIFLCMPTNTKTWRTYEMNELNIWYDLVFKCKLLHLKSIHPLMFVVVVVVLFFFCFFFLRT